MTRSIALSALALSLILLGSPARADVAAPTDQASLYKQLDKDYHKLLASDHHAEAIRQAEALLAETNQNSHWTSFFQAVELIRKNRSKAAVPLLMKYMVENATLGSSHVIIPAYVDTIRILTGEKIDYPDVEGRAADRRQAALDAVLHMYSDWWQPNKDKLAVDLGKMSNDQLQYIATELLRHSEKELSSHWGGGSREVSMQRQYEGFMSSLDETNSRREWFEEDLCPKMTPILLADAGYAPKPTDDPTIGTNPVDFPAAPLLAVLNRAGDAQEIDAIADDAKQNDATRLTCMLAMHAAGKDVSTKTLLSIYKADQRADVRMLALLMLGISDNTGGIVPKLLPALDDDNKDIRDAALEALRKIDPKAAVPKLTKVLHDGEPDDLIIPGLRILATIGGDDIAALLADYLKRTVDSGDQNKLFRALAAFSQVTGQRWMLEAGAHPPEYYQQQAHKALDWWKANHP